jgi:hypothetical protein
MGAPCVRDLGTSIAPRGRATFHQALLDVEAHVEDVAFLDDVLLAFETL